MARRIFMSTAVALYNEECPQRALGVFDACAAAQARGNELYIQITCQPLSIDFTLASAYPFHSHPAFDPIEAYNREQLKGVCRDPSFRDASASICTIRSGGRSFRATGSGSSSLHP